MITKQTDSVGYLFEMEKKGGPGSGNFGHAGIPGQVGGSGSGGKRAGDKKVGDRVEWEQTLAPSIFGTIVEIRYNLAKIRSDKGEMIDNIQLGALNPIKDKAKPKGKR
jgi:hypothetical protein